ncbi:DUF4367 domain-containing protein [Candidatus Saccharibacteria bacterium]|nr:DUF4367 domain-containing protein [Candidatus Saccharibacteria bacterium]
MGTVIINGQKYDSVTGLRIDQSDPVIDLAETEMPESPVMELAPRPRRQSKQERLAEAIAREFDDDELGVETAPKAIIEPQPVTREVPEWISEFTERQAAEHDTIVDQPAWITNYVSGGDPVEIQPIGLEAAARDAARQQAEQTDVGPSVTEFARSTPPPQHRYTQQHSRTLNRDFVQKPADPISIERRTPEPIATHPDVHRFAPVAIDDAEPETILREEKTETTFAPIMTHSLEEKLAQREIAKTPSTTPSLKDILINEQLDRPIDRATRTRNDKKLSRIRRRFTAPTLVTAALAILVLGGYFTYISMPSISVRVAAARAGVDAHAPYTPSGYSIDGPVAYAPGRVTINYKSNGGGEGYSLTQQSNSWGDNVVLDTLVENGQYTTWQVGNLTIYRYGDQAAWVDKDILFTLSGNGSLGDDQITRIAESI